MFLFYLDESGQREYGSGTSRYFVLVALALHEDRWKSISNALDDLKMTYFGTVNVEVKSDWLRFPRERKRRYCEPYKISEERLSEFGERAHQLIEKSDMTILASIIDKKQMEKQYLKPQSPSSRAYVHLFERIELYLRSQKISEHGLLVFDKINDTNFQRGGYEDLLMNQHKRYLTKGTDFVQIDRIIEGLFFIPSNANNLIQLADIAAYDIFRQFHDHGEEWDQGAPGRREFKNYYPYFGRIKGLISSSAGGQLDGYGIKKFPEVQITSGNT